MSALYDSTNPFPGIVHICAYHDQVEPGSKRKAEIWAKSQNLRISHGYCKTCAERELAEFYAQEKLRRHAS